MWFIVLPEFCTPSSPMTPIVSALFSGYTLPTSGAVRNEKTSLTPPILPT